MYDSKGTKKMITETDRAYIAGLFDGEGSICFCYHLLGALAIIHFASPVP